MKAALISIFAFMFTGLHAFAQEDGTVRNFEIDSRFVTGAHWSIQEGCGILQVALPAIKDDLPLPKPPTIRIWLLQSDGSSIKPSTKVDSPVGISMRGHTTPSLIYEFTPQEVLKAVAVVAQVEEEFHVFSLISEKKTAQQVGADQPATRPESKPEGEDKPQSRR